MKATRRSQLEWALFYAQHGLAVFSVSTAEEESDHTSRFQRCDDEPGADSRFLVEVNWGMGRATSHLTMAPSTTVL